MMYRFSSFILALLLLVASGQAGAASCTSVTTSATWGTGTTYTAWTNATAADGCNSTAGTASSLPSANEDVIVASSALAGSTAMAAKSLTINTGATFTPGSNTLTITPAATANAFVNNGTFTKGTSTIAFAAAATTVGTIDFYNLSISAGALTLSPTTTIGNNLLLTSTGTAALAATNTVTAGVTTYGTALTGTLKFVDATAGTAGTHTITASADATIPVLDLSALTTGSTIATATSNVVVTSLILPTANPVGGTAKTVVFTVPSTKTLTISSGIPSGCVATTHTIATNVITGAASGNVTCTITPSIAAPIVSTKEKAAVFTEEVKH